MITPVIAAIAIVLAWQVPAQGLTEREDMLVIDGAREPGQIPEWLAWEYSFTLVAQWHGRDNGFTHDLQDSISPAEFQLLEKAALAHTARAARRASLGAKLLEKYPHGATTDPKVLARAADEAYAIDLAYRREILGSRDRLLQAFSTESQAALLQWVAQNKSAIISYVPKPDLKRWRSPE